MTVGADRGVTIKMACSDGQQFGFSESQVKKLDKQEKYKKKWQKRLARRVKGSAGREKAKRKVARYARYAGDMRRDVAHKTSYLLANDDRYQLFVFEDLKTKNMTKRAKPKMDENGKWIRNGAAAKSGLNKSILGSTWGYSKIFLQYKARRNGKLTIFVPAPYTSQECSVCGYTHQDNRETQADFICLSCGHIENADTNAAKNIANRGVELFLSDRYAEKKVKKCSLSKKKNTMVGQVVPEPVEVIIRSTPEETDVRRVSGNAHPHWSLILETPATALCA
jgi:putative transposase